MSQTTNKAQDISSGDQCSGTGAASGMESAVASEEATTPHAIEDGPHSVSPTIPAAPIDFDSARGSPTDEFAKPLGRTRSWMATVGRIGVVARRGALVLVLMVAIYIFLRQVNEHYAIKHWLFWTYAKIWGYCTLFVLAVAGSGHLVTKTAGGKTLPFGERTVLSLGAGVIVFFLIMFGAGLLGIYGKIFSVVMPTVVFSISAVPLVRYVRRVVRHFRAARIRSTWRPSVWFLPILLFGAGGVGMIYFAILSPRNVAYDAHFYHLAIAQQYATEGAIRPFLDGWLPGTIPHLSSVLYTWTFLLPGLTMFDRVVCAAHIEFILFLFTLVSVPIFVRRLVPKARTSLSWAAFFLFPGIFVYDSGLSAAAEHIAAFWAIPVYLMMLRSLRSLDVWNSQGAFAARDFGFLSASLAAAILTKYQAIYVAAFPAMAIAATMVWILGRAFIRRENRRLVLRTIFVGTSTALVVGLVLTSPHWLKNYIWYGDPFFPYLHRHFPAPKWTTTDIGVTFNLWNEQTKSWKPQGPLLNQLRETAQAMATFSFQPHDWPKFHGKVPIFGSLFTLSALTLPFLQKTKRIWALFIATEVGIGIWFWTLHQDRYLQQLLPWMVGVVAATLILLWRSHWAIRVLAAALVGVQIIWGGDAYFIPAHAMTGTSAAPITSELLSMGLKGKHSERYAFGDRLFEIGRDPALPQHAKVLLHEWQTRLGLWRPVVSDFPGHMYAFRYEELSSPAEVDKRMRGLGITHIVTRAQISSSYDSLGSDLQFFAFIDQDVTLVKKFSDWSLYALRPTPTTRTSNNLVAYLGCDPQYERGLYTLSRLSVRDRLMAKKPARVTAMKPVPAQPQEFASFVAQVDYVVTSAKCKPAMAPEVTQDFNQIATRDGDLLWLRRR